ncbi:RNA-directed DNA polymerase, eukaryota, reverse transcriptase zinc-binding domain protein [Tanacetum coccineum]
MDPLTEVDWIFDSAALQLLRETRGAAIGSGARSRAAVTPAPVTTVKITRLCGSRDRSMLSEWVGCAVCLSGGVMGSGDWEARERDGSHSGSIEEVTRSVRRCVEDVREEVRGVSDVSISRCLMVGYGMVIGGIVSDQMECELLMCGRRYCFGLKVNPLIRVLSIAFQINEVHEVASSLGCMHDSLPFMYLGLPVGKKMRLCDGWNEVINYFRERLSAWKAKAFSISGRLTPVKSVLGSLPIYYLSLFKAPKKNSILLKSSMGGLGVGSLLAKNIGLLGKWKWRFLTEKDALWRTVIKEFYRECGGFGSLAGSRGPNGIWCDIIKAVEDIKRIDPSFKRSFHIKVSNGANVSFWKDPWCENGTRLMDLFPRLYALDSFQDCKIGYGECYRLGFNAITHGEHRFSYPDSTDRWSWSKDASGIYKVITLSNTFQSISLADCNLGVQHKWDSWIPRKVNICVWRGSLNRLPTRINLSSRGIPLVTTLCPFCNNEEEDLDHCLIKCSRVLPIWKKVWSWWHLPPPSTFPSFGIKDIALGTFSSNGCLLSNKAIHGVFQSTFWAIWKWRNKIINAQQDRVDSIREEDIFPSIQRVSRIWISARASSRPANWNCWIPRPFDLFTAL